MATAEPGGGNQRLDMDPLIVKCCTKCGRPRKGHKLPIGDNCTMEPLQHFIQQNIDARNKRMNLIDHRRRMKELLEQPDKLSLYYKKSTSVTVGTDAESMEAGSQPGASSDIPDAELVQGASEASVVSSPVSASPQIADGTVSTVLVHGAEVTSTEVKSEDELELKEEEEDIKEEDIKEEDIKEEDSSVSAETNMDKKEIESTGEKVDPDTQSPDPKPSASTPNDLDEMMDIGTVDEVEQEAQMKDEEEEEEDGSMDVDGSSSPATSKTASASEHSNAGKEEEPDEKPTVFPPPDDQGEDVKVAVDPFKSSTPPSSEASTGRESSSPATMTNGMKVVKLSIPPSDTDKSCVANRPIKTPSPPSVSVKDEPVDEEYDQALISSTSEADVKDEPNTAKQEELKIGSVYSVTPAAETRPLPDVTRPLPDVGPSSLHMSCSNCSTSLVKGQTAFQRKGSPALFCSTVCLTTSLPTGMGAAKVCYNCQKLIFRPQDVILAPDTKGVMKDFCSQNCLTSFNYKKSATANSQKTLMPMSLCSMCTRPCISKHEVILNRAVHKICSDACFNRFRTVNNLAVAGCANCSSFCHNKPLMLKMDDGNKTLCNTECLAQFKQKTKINHPCAMCRVSRCLSDTVDHKNPDDSVSLFCTSSCKMAFMVQSVSASGSRVNCDNCEKNTVPSYHLAMSDTSIRNFCSLPCVMAFQDKFKKAQNQMNIFTKLPIGSPQIQSIIPSQPLRDVPKGPSKLGCSQCNRHITSKPEVVQIKGKMVFVCGIECSQEFRKVHNVTCLCEYCNVIKITGDARRIDNKDCFFCSDGCKLLYKHDLTKSWGKHCHSCVYCHSVSRKLVTAQYGGSTEEFCSEDCRSKYTMLFCHVAKCETCGLKGKLKQSLPLLGEVKHFCETSCLLQFCCDTVTNQCALPKGTCEDTPVIANVMSLAGKLNAADRTARQSSVSNVKSKRTGHISIQTDTVGAHAALPAPKIMKNKALLCRPMVQNKGITCKAQTVDCESQTDDAFPKVMIIPVPVPVYVPVPMNMYSQFAPSPVGVPIPLPVPMFLPVTIDSAERIVETIQEIKERIPSDPFEAELILMAEMVAEDDQKNVKPERPKEKVEPKASQRPEAPAATDDHASNYSDDLDPDDLASFLWDDVGFRSPGRPYSEKLHPPIDIPVGNTYSEPPSPAAQHLDIEADFTVETLERVARLREEAQRSPSPPPTAARRRQTHRKARDKRGRKAQRASKALDAESQRGSHSKAVAVDPPKMKSQYGVDAWKRWIQWRQTQPNLEKPRFGSRPIVLKEDLLRCTTTELSYGLCCFITEVKRQNGETYSTDSLFYLCLGIQQYLFENGRVENIFMDRFYAKFSTDFSSMLRGFKPLITASGYVHSRVEEDFLWDCKQLGAYSPIVLLNTLLFFFCKFFGFSAVEQHRQLSFAHVMRCTKTNQNNSKTTFLRFYPPISTTETEAETDPEVPAKKRKEEEPKEEILEMMENTENPLRCPVRLYEFYLSKCSESVKQRTNLFYLHPERCCVPNSPLWFSSTALDDGTMEAMLLRILTVRELHLTSKKGRGAAQDDPPFIPDGEEEGDSE